MSSQVSASGCGICSCILMDGAGTCDKAVPLNGVTLSFIVALSSSSLVHKGGQGQRLKPIWILKPNSLTRMAPPFSPSPQVYYSSPGHSQVKGPDLNPCYWTSLPTHDRQTWDVGRQCLSICLFLSLSFFVPTLSFLPAVWKRIASLTR